MTSAHDRMVPDYDAGRGNRKGFWEGSGFWVRHTETSKCRKRKTAQVLEFSTEYQWHGGGTHPAVEAWAVKALWGRGHWTRGRNCTCCSYRALLIKEIRSRRVLGPARKNVLPDSVRVINLTWSVLMWEIRKAGLPKAGYPQMWLNCVLTELVNSYKTWTTQHTTVTISGHALKA